MSNLLSKRLNHIAIAVPDLSAARLLYQKLGAPVSEIQTLAEHGVRVAFVEVGNTKIELLHPFGQDSPIAAFLTKNPSGAIHHLCLEVPDITAARNRLAESGIRLLGDGLPRLGAHGNPVVFAHPKDMGGVLFEFEEVRE